MSDQPGVALQGSTSLPPCVLFEDEHLLVINKPAGINTHAPGPSAGEGLYDWLKHRERRWATLAIIHRLDKETSGLMVFGKTPLANRTLTEQFTRRSVRKKYLLVTDRVVTRGEIVAKSSLVRLGEKYVGRPLRPGGDLAETRFEVRNPNFKIRKGSDHRDDGCFTLIEAEPLTGRTHQIRVHAAESGFPILGDTLYGGTPASRVHLHAAELAFRHPATGETVRFDSAPDFDADARLALRVALVEPEATNAFRLLHGASDGWPGWYVDQLGEFVLSQSAQALSRRQGECLRSWISGAPLVTPHASHLTASYHKVLTRRVQRSGAGDVSPQLVAGVPAPERIKVRENSAWFEVSFSEGYSVGLFLDQRDNRWRFLTGHVAADFSLHASPSDLRVLNTFAYTCGFSVCAALAGAKTTSLDLSRKYLEWGKRNFALNGLDPAGHDFIFGDAFDWLKRLAKKGRVFDVVILDPPTFSQSKAQGAFRAEKDYGKLVKLSLPLVNPGGVLFASTNAAAWPADEFIACVTRPIRDARRRITQQHFVPQPPDFPISREEPAYLKTLWLRIA